MLVYSEEHYRNGELIALGEQFDVDPEMVLHRHRSPREYGDSFERIRKSGVVKFTNYENESVGKRDWYLEGTSNSRTTTIYHDGYRVDDSTRTVYRSSWDWIRANWVDISDVSSTDEINLAKMQSEAVAKALEAYDALTDLAEAKSSIVGITRILRKLTRILLSYKKRLAKGDLDPTKAWLEYRYGIMPLVLSAKDLIDALDSAKYRFRKGKIVRTQTTVSRRGSKPEQVYGYYFRDSRVERTVSVHWKVKYGSSQHFNGVNKDFIRFNWATTAWELVTLSFVIDWFVNVGEFILAHTQKPKDAELHFCYSVREKGTTAVVATQWIGGDSVEVQNYLNPGMSYSNSSNQWITGVVHENFTNSYVRRVFTPSDVQLTFEVSLNNYRMLDALALAVNALKRVR